MKEYRFFKFVAVALIVLLTGCDKKDGAPKSKTGTNSAPTVRFPEISYSELGIADSRILETNIAEDLTIQLTPRLKEIGLLLQGVACNADSVLAQEKGSYLGIEDFDFKAAIEALEKSEQFPVTKIDWPLATSQSPGVSSAALWNPLKAQYKFEDAQFGIVSTELRQSEQILRMETSFEGRFSEEQTTNIYGVKAYQTVDWSIVDNDWKISKWEQKSFEIGRASRTLFSDVTASTIKSEAALETLRKSPHREYLKKRLDEKSPPQREKTVRELIPDWESAFQYTSVSVFDYNNDGADDLLVLDRAAKPVLLVNSGEGYFEDRSQESGLEQAKVSGNCGLLFDYDNDGDSDLLVGRSIDSSLFFRNENGNFVADDPTNELLKDVKFVTSGSVCDVNRDGLLDVYLCTYAAGGNDPQYSKYIVPESQRVRLERLTQNGHPFTNRGGPPNVLLINKGTGFERARLPFSIEQWRHSYQASWTDFDSDGDQDLYICNDFAPDCLLRNDTPKLGEPKFSDVTKEILPGEMGFGMGASFGDYNSDGQIDLYVSNMYSKAGNRVLKQLGGQFDPRIRAASQGNFLLKNNGGKFEQVAGTDSDSQHVSKVGWSFGGQMLDLNNDSHLDIYVPSGYYTAPKSADSNVDL